MNKRKLKATVQAINASDELPLKPTCRALIAAEYALAECGILSAFTPLIDLLENHGAKFDKDEALELARTFSNFKL